MKPAKKLILQLITIISEKRAYCYWCGRQLRQCGTCKGSGKYKEHICYPCNGTGLMCPTHEADWE